MNVYEEIAREAKCERLSKILFFNRIHSFEVAQIDDPAWWQKVATLVKVNPPSEKSIERTIELLVELESAAWVLSSEAPAAVEEGGSASSHPTPRSYPPSESSISEAPRPVFADVVAAPSGRQTGTDKLPASAIASDDASRGPVISSGPAVQASIFDAPFQAHSETSREAAKRIHPARTALHQRIINLLREEGPLTDEEMQDLLGMNPSTQRPRRVELMKAGIVVRVGKRKTKSSRPANLWALAELRVVSA